MCRCAISVLLLATAAAACLAATVPIEVQNPAGVALQAEPVTTGVPFPEGALESGENVRLLDEAGAELPLQVTVTGEYPDGSVRWLLLDFQADLPAEGATFTLEFGEDVTRAPIDYPLSIDLSAGEPFFLPYFVDDAGIEYQVDRADIVAAAEIELAGPMRGVVTARGWYVNDVGEQKCRYIVRIHGYRGKPYVRVFYTWIMTEDSRELRFSDIGFRIPMPVERAIFGTADGPAERLVSAEQPTYLLQYDHDRSVIESAGEREETGRAPGWFAGEGRDGHCVLACRDFWQLFPKELEATPEGVIFHTWPDHGVADPTPEVTDANLQYLWFAHEGDVLDFQVPESYYAHEGEYSEYEMRYVRSSKEANGMGVAKTHELLMAFGDGAVDPDEAEALNARLQDPPVAMASPEWMCASGVFGMIDPVDEDAFGKYEAMVAGTFDAERRMQEFTEDYGLWNFGGGHTTWDVARRRWHDVYRCWRNTHHGCNRVPWLLYVRSGDRDYRRYGVRNARKVLDEGFCHWSTEEFEGLDWPRSKIHGALCDYKGLVHWHAGGRLTDYNSTTDFALWYWHLTGDRRGLEVAQQWGDAVVEEDRSPFGHREGAGTCAAMIELYKETLDQRYFAYAKRLAEHLISTQNEDGSFPQWENYAPWLERWWELTGDEAAARAIVRFADAYIAGNGDSFSTYHVAGQVNILAYAYVISGDPKYLARGLWELDRLEASVYRGEDPLLQGLIMAGQTSLSGYGVQRAPNLLAAIARHGEPVEPDPLFRITEGFALPFLRERPIIDGEPTKIETVEAWLLEREDAPFTLSVSTEHSYDQAEWTLVVTAPDGTEAARHVETYPSGGKVFELAVPADGQTGIYRLTVARPGSFGATHEPIGVEPALPVAFPIEGRLFPRDEAGYCIYVPPGTTSLQLRVRAIEGATSVQLTAPEGEREHWQIASNDEQTLTEPMAVPDGAAGATWLLHRSGDVNTLQIIGEGADVP
ncbi:MAG: hypothetical protein U9R79_07705, partial [Armatimonadota bacterium]|nr:hypothetical protein [Armatimonadota bacterium]